ncbi:WD repeat-containing protein 11 [Dermatophagoides farinae]|uniref:WD repeat-containing protein 11 n=1 Tax=Dermatophagoides farinae TaxID=6954 RepID=A0A922I0V3_DERFA|nr:WD repeat-containing protein 11 [Dermatophagoides farinae]
MQSNTTVEQSLNDDHETNTRSQQSIRNEKQMFIQRNSSTCSSPLESPKIPIDSQSRSSSSLSYSYTLFPSTISGVLHAQNSGALDWSSNGLIAYGCQNLVVIVDTRPTLSFRQTLHRHKHIVCLVKWSPLTNHLCLCSIDTIGMIVVWDVIESAPLTVILSTTENRSISFIHWIHLDKKLSTPNRNSVTGKINCWDLVDFDMAKPDNNDQEDEKSDNCKNNDNIAGCLATNLYLLSFYPHNNTIIVYDADLGEPVCRWQIDCLVSHIHFNPFFYFNRCCNTSMQNLLFEFRSTNSDRIYLGLARLDEHHLKDNDQTSKEPQKIHLPITMYVLKKINNKSGYFDLIQRLDKSKLTNDLIAIKDHTQSSAGIRNNSITQGLTPHTINNDYQLLQIEFHKAVRNQIFLVFSRDIYLIDLSMEMIITTIPIERNFSRLNKIFSCGLRNAFYALHENGNVSFRLYQKKIIRDNLSINHNNQHRSDELGNQANFLNIGYVNLCYSEPIRLTKQNKIFGYSLSPFDETKVAFLLSTGRIIFKSLLCQKSSFVHNLSLPSLNDLIKPQEYKLGAFLINANEHDDDDDDDIGHEDQRKQSVSDAILYKIIVTNYISGLNSLPTVIRMAPPLTVQNLNEHKPLLAVGDSLGILQIWLLNNNTATLHREFCAHSYAIAGVEWADLTSLITFSYPTITSPAHSYTRHPLSALQNLTTGSGSSSGRVTNELIHIDIETGKLSSFRTNHMTDSSPIETIRVSHLKQYLIILFKHDDPFEIWDVRTLTILRTMSKSIGLVTAVEWSPLYNRKQMAKNSAATSDLGSDSDTGSIRSTSSLIHPLPVKENFIVMSRELYHFSIEGNIVRELARIPSDVESGNITVTSIAWKSDQVLFGDASGTLNLWDLKRKNSRTEATYRTCIKKVRFGPGRGNMKCLILYADFGVDIWDIEEFRLCSQLKFPRDINFKIIDFDWVSCDLPVFATAEGFIVISDQKLKTYSSPLNSSRLSNWSFARLDLSQFRFEDLNTNFLDFGHRKELIRKFLFEIPFTKRSISTDDGYENHDDDQEQHRSNNDDESQMIVDIRQYIDNQILLAKLFSNQNDYDFWLLLGSILLDEELDSRMDLFLDNQNFRQLLQEKLMLLEHNRRTYFHANQVYRMNLNLKNFHRAVQVLLESEHLFNQSNRIDDSMDKQAFYVDALKACLIAALQQTSNNVSSKCNQSKDNNRFVSGDDYSIENCSLTENDDSSNHQTHEEDNSIENDDSNHSMMLNETRVAPVVKLVSTSLIANGHITEGIELLTIISKTSDACRYLQSSEQWFDSIWLAKSSLDGNECTEIMRRWCDYLISSKRYYDQQTALKIYLSRRQFSRVLRALNQFGDCKSFPLAVICIGAQLIDMDANMDCIENIFRNFANHFFDDESLFEKIKDSNCLNIDIDDSLKKCWALFFPAKT